MNVTIEFCVPNDAYTCAARHSCNIFIVDLIWPDLDLDLYLVGIRSILICYLLHHLKSLSAKFGFAAVVSPFSGADKAKSDDFNLWPDLDLTFYLFSIF